MFHFMMCTKGDNKCIFQMVQHNDNRFTHKGQVVLQKAHKRQLFIHIFIFYLILQLGVILLCYCMLFVKKTSPYLILSKRLLVPLYFDNYTYCSVKKIHFYSVLQFFSLTKVTHFINVRLLLIFFLPYKRIHVDFCHHLQTGHSKWIRLFFPINHRGSAELKILTPQNKKGSHFSQKLKGWILKMILQLNGFLSTLHDDLRGIVWIISKTVLSHSKIYAQANYTVKPPKNREDIRIKV